MAAGALAARPSMVAVLGGSFTHSTMWNRELPVAFGGFVTIDLGTGSGGAGLADTETDTTSGITEASLSPAQDDHC